MIKSRNIFYSVFLLSFLSFAGIHLHAQELHQFRIGLQVGMAAERSSYIWLGSKDNPSRLEVDAQQNGWLGIILEFPISNQLQLEFGPHYGQRNIPITSLQRLGGVNFTLLQDPVDYLGFPVMVKYLPFTEGLILPYIGAGAEFGMNLSSLHVTIEEYRFSEEPPLSSTLVKRRNINQLYGAVIAEAGLDIRASSSWSVILGLRYSQELNPLIDDALLIWDTPHSWKLRFALLYTFGEGL